MTKTFFVALNTGYADHETPSDEAVRFYSTRSGHGLYAAIVGNVVLPHGFATNNVCMRISDSPRWRMLADAIRGAGAIPGIQLGSAWPNYRGIRSFKAPRGEDSLAAYRYVAQSQSRKDIQKVFEDLRFGTELAIAAGFRHVQLHAAHGYLFCLLVDQSLCGHHQFALDLIADWLGYLQHARIECSIRISLSTGDPALDLGRSATIDALCLLGADFIDVSDGYYNFDKHLIYPSKPKTLRARHEATFVLASRFPLRQFILSGRAAEVDLSFRENVHFGLCRDLIANPNFLGERHSGCANKMQCHFYSTGRATMSCALWTMDKPEISRDRGTEVTDGP